MSKKPVKITSVAANKSVAPIEEETAVEVEETEETVTEDIAIPEEVEVVDITNPVSVAEDTQILSSEPSVPVVEEVAAVKLSTEEKILMSYIEDYMLSYADNTITNSRILSTKLMTILMYVARKPVPKLLDKLKSFYKAINLSIKDAHQSFTALGSVTGQTRDKCIMLHVLMIQISTGDRSPLNYDLITPMFGQPFANYIRQYLR